MKTTTRAILIFHGELQTLESRVQSLVAIVPIAPAHQQSVVSTAVQHFMG